eukprot:3941951-Rhodomonas_salina.3
MHSAVLTLVRWNENIMHSAVLTLIPRELPQTPSSSLLRHHVFLPGYWTSTTAPPLLSRTLPPYPVSSRPDSPPNPLPSLLFAIASAPSLICVEVADPRMPCLIEVRPPSGNDPGPCKRTTNTAEYTPGQATSKQAKKQKQTMYSPAGVR